MTTLETNRPLTGMIAAVILMAGPANADPVDRYVALDVHNPRAFVMALDAFRESGVMDGTNASLWGGMFDGSNPATHVLAISYDDYEELQRTDDHVRSSREWADYQRAIDGASDLVGLSMGIERFADGSDWHEHGAGITFNMTVSDPATYAAEFEKLIDAADNPGAVRLIEVRAGGQGATHFAIVTAPDFVTLNNYLDELFDSDGYRDFAGKVGGIRRINTTSIYRQLQSWEN